MTVRIVNKSGAPGTYSRHETALAAASSGDEIRTTEAGNYFVQDLSGFSALTDITFTNTSGGEVVIGDDVLRATYFLSPGNNWTIRDVTLRYNVVAFNRVINLEAKTGVVFEDVILDPINDPFVNYLMRTSSSSVTMRRVKFIQPVTTCYLTSDVGSTTFTFDQVDFDSLGRYVYPNTGSNVIALACRSDGAIIDAWTGKVTGSHQVKGCYAPTLVSGTLARIAFDGADNVYNTTSAGTTGTRDQSGITSFDADDRGYPVVNGNLYRKVPVGTQYGAGSVDLEGGSRLTGGQQDIGPIQQPADRPRFPLCMVV